MPAVCSEHRGSEGGAQETPAALRASRGDGGAGTAGVDQYMAMGFPGDPVAPFIFRGAQANRNSDTP
ncbi:MAG: hypothetical protein V3U60_14805, partial [Gammaproteobacteria bacterium]